MTIYWAHVWPDQDPYTVHDTRSESWTDMLEAHYLPEFYDTPRKRKNQIAKLRRMGVRVVKVRIVRI